MYRADAVPQIAAFPHFTDGVVRFAESPLLLLATLFFALLPPMANVHSPFFFADSNEMEFVN